MNAVVHSVIDLSAREVGGLFKRAHVTHLDSVQLLLQCGSRLKEIREGLPHGEWLPWLEANRFDLGFGERTAQLLIAGAAQNTKLASDLAPADALKLNRQIWGHVDRQPREARQSAPEVPAAAAVKLPDEADYIACGLNLFLEVARLRDPAESCRALSVERRASIARLASEAQSWIGEFLAAIPSAA